MAKRKTRDYTARRRNENSDDTNTTVAEVKWWSSETGMDAAAKLWTWVDRLRSQWSVDGISDLIHEAIYADEPIARGGMFDGMRWSSTQSRGGGCMLNVIKSLVDTGTAHLTKIRSMPCISARNGSYSEKRFATNVSAVIRTKMGGQDIETAHPLVIRDGLIRRAGVWKTECVDGDTVTKRIPIYEVLWDHREVQFGPPLSLAHVRPESREKMMARYPKYRQEIANAPLFTRMDPWMQFIYQGPSLCDLIEVAESWHPPSSPENEDGQHIVCIRGCTVLREPWIVPRFPIEFMYWTPPVRGVSGKGLVAENAAAQDFINGVLHDAREGIREASQLKVFVPRGANVNPLHLRSGSPRFVEIDGPPSQVQFIAPNPVSQQAWDLAFQMAEKMYSNSGISEWAATANKPLGNNVSGKALDTMNDNQSDRMANVETVLQQARVGIGRCIVDCARHMYLMAHGKLENDFDEAPDYPEKADLAEWIRETPWDVVDIDGGSYHLTLEPINFITGTRGGRLEEIAEAAKAGLIPDPTMVAGMMEEPDIQRMNRPILGPLHRIEKCVSGLADTRVDYMDVAPDSTMNLQLATLMVKGEREEAMSHENIEDDVIKRFDMFLADVKNLQDNMASPSLPGAMPNTQVAQPNAGTLQPGAPPMPGAGPMPPPGIPGPGPGGLPS